MCIRDSTYSLVINLLGLPQYKHVGEVINCLLYTSDAADDTPCVDLGGRRIIKKNKLSRNTKEVLDAIID